MHNETPFVWFLRSCVENSTDPKRPQLALPRGAWEKAEGDGNFVDNRKPETGGVDLRPKHGHDGKIEYPDKQTFGKIEEGDPNAL